MKTRSYLALMVAVIIFPILILAGWGVRQMLNDEREARIGMVEAKARAIALDIDQEISHSEGALQMLTNTKYLKQKDFASLYDLMDKGHSDQGKDTWFVLYNYDGTVQLNTYAPYGTRFTGIHYDWVKPAIDSGSISVSNLRIGQISKAPLVSVNVPIMTPDGKKYMLSQVFLPSHFTRTLSAHGTPKSWIVGLFGSDGITITRNKEFEKFGGKPVRKELVEAANEHASGRISNISREGIPVYTVFTRTQHTGWRVAIGVPQIEIEAPARRAAYYGALAIALVFGIAALTVLFLGRRLTQGFNSAVDAAHELGKGRIPVIKQTEVDEANILQSALHDAGVSLSEENQSRLVLEQERERLLKSEKEARRLAEDQNKAKDEFLAMLAHELRNPLAPISAAADILKIAGMDETTIRRSSDVISRQVKHMKELVDDLLDVSRVTRGLVELEKEDIDIKTVVSHAIEQARPLIESRGHELTIRMDAAHANVHGDKTRLVQVICNILTNAAKYTPQGGQINLAVEVQAEQVSISIADNGIGINPALLPHVFELFRQAERTPDRSQGGLGLGLALVKSIVALHDGKVEVHSDGLGKGSRFTLTLPTVASEVKADVSHIAESVTEPGRLYRIMIVDDNLDAANSLATLLKALGHQVNVKESGEAALAEATKYSAQIYILDIGLPDMNGYELARQLRVQQQNAEAIFIALTGYGQAHDKVLSKAAGFDHHCVKPMDMALLDQILSRTPKQPDSAKIEGPIST